LTTMAVTKIMPVIVLTMKLLMVLVDSGKRNVERGMWKEECGKRNVESGKRLVLMVRQFIF
ncbi:MAG: hypothetical protein II546_05415, partial [Prevotella sp.]|nr:hypothetical protein [Prevotella sp.]